MPQLSIIIPTFNEEACIEHTLLRTQACAPDAEILVVDGTSTDKTIAIASKHARVICAKRGRGGQLNAGVAATQGTILLFLHADTLPERTGIDELLTVMQDESVDGGAFRMRFDDTRPMYQRICQNITQRSLRTKSYTGDQGIFTRRSVFQRLDGYRNWPFMEDVDYSERMGKMGYVVLLNAEVETSARRHLCWGLLRTQLTVVLIRILYLLKVHPAVYEWLWPPIR
ncbi:MAG: TIGR04283 family arsenosugar biosynthesis glycosyltransferase [Ktedonobacteraceae bacterium]